MDFDLRRLAQAKKRVLVVVSLNDAACLESNLLTHELTESIDYRALRLRFGATWIDDLATHITTKPKLIDLERIVRTYGYLGDMREVALETVMKRDTESGTLGRLRLPHPDFSATSCRTPRMRATS